MIENCKCVARFNEQLVPQGLEVETQIMMTRNASNGVSGLASTLVIRTVKASGKGGKTPPIIPSFCPFCGTKYETNEVSP